MSGINYRNFRGLDLTSLLAFDALMRERSVTRAAARLALGQPAVSQILAKLRTRYADPLFIRAAGGLEPTIKALQVHPALLDGLRQIQTTIEARSKEAAPEPERVFRIGLPDLVETALMPRLFDRTRREAPLVQFRTIAAPRVVALEMLDNRLIDLAINYLPETHSWHHRAKLFDDDYVCVTRRSNRISGRFTLERFLNYDHVVAESRDGQTDRVTDTLDQLQLRRRIVHRTSSYLLMAMMLSSCDAIGTIPRRLGAPIIERFNLSTRELPLAVPSFPLSASWHNRQHNDPAFSWVKSLVIDVMKEASLLPRRR